MANFDKILLFRHFLYRIIRSVIMCVQDVYYYLTRNERHFVHQQDQAEIATIVYRRKLIEADMTSPNDFVWIHDEFVSSDVLLTPNWSLYTVDEKYAYFILMPKPAVEYTVNIAPFVYMKQFTDGLKLAKCNWENFSRMTLRLDENRGPIVFESNAARSGSTLMSQLLQASNGATVLGEPDAFTALTNLVDKGLMNEEQVVTNVRSIIKFSCKAQSSGEIYIIKTQSNCVRLVPYIKRAMPDVKHFFMFRKNTRRILSSAEKILRHGTGGEEMIFLRNRISSKFACWLINFASFEYAFVQRFGTKDCMDYAILCHLSCYNEYIKNRALFDIPWVLYEDLIADPRQTLTTVFELCGIPIRCLDDALKVMNKDSQAGTILSQDVLKNFHTIELTEEKIQKIQEICHILDVPMLET